MVQIDSYVFFLFNNNKFRENRQSISCVVKQTIFVRYKKKSISTAENFNFVVNILFLNFRLIIRGR